MNNNEKSIIAKGEVTGHAHRTDKRATVSGDWGERLISAPDGTTITHEEHAPCTLPPGEYDSGIAQEYDPMGEEVREVRD